MFQDTRPAELDPEAGPDPWAPFRVGHPRERLALLRELRDGNVPLVLNAPDGSALPTTVWALDEAQGRMNLFADTEAPQMQGLVQSNEAVAVAYLEAVKLQFDLQGFVLVRAARAQTLQCGLPREIYRFQRRNAFRVRAGGSHTPVARLRHPALPEMRLELRVLDVSLGGCALWLPHDVPPLQPGTRLGEVHVELDAQTHFNAPLRLQHVGAVGQGEGGARLGCEWQPLPGGADRVLQRWIDRTQQRRRHLSLK